MLNGQTTLDGIRHDPMTTMTRLYIYKRFVFRIAAALLASGAFFCDVAVADVASRGVCVINAVACREHPEWAGGRDDSNHAVSNSSPI